MDFSSIRFPPWSDLPLELLTQIGKCLQSSIVDVFRFRAVCRSWRASFSLHSHGNLENYRYLSQNLPIQLQSPPRPVSSQSDLYPRSNLINSYFCLTATTSFLLYPIHDVTGVPFGNSCSLLTVDELNPGKLCLREPLSGLYQKTWAKKSLPLSLDLLRFHVGVVAEHFVVRHLYVLPNSFENMGAGHVLKPSWLGEKLSAKAVLLWNFSLAVVLLQDGHLAVIGLKDMEWKVSNHGIAHYYDDIVKDSRDNLVYGVDRIGRAYVISVNPESGSIDQVPFASELVGCSFRCKRLVVDSSCDRLLLVECRAAKSKMAFSVYKLELRRQNSNNGLQKWEKISTLDDRILFVDFHFSMCASARDFCGLTRNCPHNIPRNCIFFTRGSFPVFGGFTYSDDKKFFEGVGAHTNVGMFCLEDDHAVGLLEPGLDALLLPPIFGFSLSISHPPREVSLL